MSVKRRLYNVIRPQKKVELISIHIPKTAGTSLTNILRRQYPDALELLYQHNNNSEKNKQMWQGEPIVLGHRGIRCIHGHFPAKLSLKQSYPEAKIITWMRNPVERMISTYNYYKKLPLNHNQIHRRFINENWDIIDLSYNLVHEVKSYLGDFRLEDFDFIGFTECQQKSLVSLSNMMNWNMINTDVFENVNSTKTTFDYGVKDKLKQILKEEVEMYELAQKLFISA
ncbi:sulfotransferase domain-containing protein [Tamlana flava]|uniref:sulfotransferase domain-containing protein n=1 Tax=Tamlana flava TaxID=3158572 RepID=UPI00351B79AA